MLIRNLKDHFLYNVDAVDTPTDTQPTKDKEGQGEGKLTQAEVDKLVGSTRKAARETGRKELLEELGIDSADTLKALLKAHQEREEAEKTEAQKLAERLAALEKQSAEKDAKLAEVEKQRRLDRRDSAVMQLLQKAHNPEQVLILMKASLADKLDALLDDSGAFDKESAQKLIADYQKDNAFLFKDTSHGSSYSTRDGRAFQHDKADKEEAAKRTFKTARNSV